MKKFSEFVWEKLGAIAICSLIGAVYGMIVSPVILWLVPQITMAQVVKVFCLVFSAIGLISSRFLINMSVGLIYSVVGFFAGLGAVGGAGSEMMEKCWRNSMGFTLLGIICGAVVFFLYG